MAGFAVLVLSYVLSQFYRSFLAVLTPVLSQELSASAGQLATASGAWFVAFALMQFPVGYSLDRHGPRRTAGLLFAIAGGGGAALFATSQTPMQLIAAMALIGVGCSPVLMATLYLFARRYSAVRFATLTSTFIAIGTLGNIIGSEPLVAAANAIGWRYASWGLCAITIAVGIGIFLIVRDPEPVAGSAETGQGSFWKVLKIRQLWPIFPCILLGYSVAAGIRGLWVGPLLEDVYQLGDFEIGRISLYMAIALSAGSLLYGPLDRIFDTRKYVVVLGNLVVAVAVLWLAVALPENVTVTTMLVIVIGFFGASYAVQMAHGKAFVPAHMVGRGVTLMNFFSIGGVGVMQLATGFTFEKTAASNGALAGYQAIFWLYAITLSASVVLYLFSREAKPSQDRI